MSKKIEIQDENNICNTLKFFMNRLLIATIYFQNLKKISVFFLRNIA